jgi:hypothetical protein
MFYKGFEKQAHISSGKIISAIQSRAHSYGQSLKDVAEKIPEADKMFSGKADSRAIKSIISKVQKVFPN